MRDAYRARETELDAAIRDLQAGEREKGQRLRLAEAADAELRHRHPRQPWPPLPAAEPQPGRGHAHGREHESGVDSGHSRGHGRESQPPAPATGLAETSPQVQEAAARHRDLAARLTGRHSLTIPAEEPVQDLSPAFLLTGNQRRTAILQPPKPEIQPSSWVLERAVGRDWDLDLDLEAAAD